MDRKRKLTPQELLEEANSLWDESSDSEPFQDSDSDYSPSSSDTCSEVEKDFVENNLDSSSSECNEESNPSEVNNSNDQETSSASKTSQVVWHTSEDDFSPKHVLSDNNLQCVPLIKADRSSTELEVFTKIFPKSLIIYISQCTNERLNILKQAQKKQKENKIELTDPSEIMIVLGSLLVMSYNRVPNLHHYWSTKSSIGNTALKSAISTDRFLMLLSKLYFTNPVKPAECSKTYYVDEVMTCLKKTFINGRSESNHQSIDESMTKFKGRSVLKQYLPLKPIKRGIKIWQRCDALTGYVYDMNIYAGKETEVLEDTLGERVVSKLCQTIRIPNVTLCFDRFFTSVHLMNNLSYPAVGTCMSNRRELPKFTKKLKQRGDIETHFSTTGLLAVKWKDTKEVIVISNCHEAKVNEIERKCKDGTKANIPCPEAISFYNKFMGGVDLADQLAGLYDIDRKSQKWWKKVFYKLFMTSVVNAWILFQEINHKKIPLIQFVVSLAEQLIAAGRTKANVKRRKMYGRPSKASAALRNVGEHLPIEGKTRRRCHNCHKKHVEKRTKIYCSQCNIALCMSCFTTFHT